MALGQMVAVRLVVLYGLLVELQGSAARAISGPGSVWCTLGASMARLDLTSTLMVTSAHTAA